MAAGLLAGAMAVTGGCGDDDPLAAAYRLVIEPCAGPTAGRASAAAVGPDLLATAAHSLDRARSVVVADADQLTVPGTVVHLDLAKDIALIRTSEPQPSHLGLVEPADDGLDAPVELLTYAEEDGPVVKAGRILELVDVTLDGEGRRAAIRLEGDIEPGDSGSAVIEPGGAMIGMVFASARDHDSGWAVAASEIAAAIEEVEQSQPGPALPGC